MVLGDQIRVSPGLYEEVSRTPSLLSRPAPSDSI